MNNTPHKKECPNCKTVMYYSNKYDLKYSIINNTICKKCSSIGKNIGRRPSLETRKKLSDSHKGKTSPNKGRKWSDEYKKNMSERLMGRIFSKEHKEKISNTNKGRLLTEEHKQKLRTSKSEETKYKLRIATIEDLKKKGILVGKNSSKNFNPSACRFIDGFGKKNGYNFRHAMNGGEVELYGYFVDGYDKENNIIFEYDEKHHKSSYCLKKDKIRQNNLIKNINPNKFIRYDEMNNRLYDTITNTII